ncbi:MAG: hypothetical protein QXS54_01675 [Candidatus Methanomethylicaceae archaeon]
MEEPRIGCNEPLIAHPQPPEAPQPGDGALHDLVPPVPTQLPPILVRAARWFLRAGMIGSVPPRLRKGLLSKARSAITR